MIVKDTKDPPVRKKTATQKIQYRNKTLIVSFLDKKLPP